jgi:hypothetical protein
MGKVIMEKPFIRDVGALLQVVSVSLLCVLFSIGCKKSPRHINIGGPLAISPDGESLTMTISSTEQGQAKCTEGIYILGLRKQSGRLQRLEGIKKLLGIAWRSPQELYVVSASDVKLSTAISAIRVSDGRASVFPQISADDFIILEMSWNASGCILAARLIRYRGEGTHLGIADCNDKNIHVTDIPISGGRVVWIDDNTLYVQDGNDILEVYVENKKPQIKRRETFDEKIFLSCSFNGKPVYFKDGEIYCGGQLLYRSDRKIRMVAADDSYLALREGDYVVILDKKGGVINRRYIGDNSKFIALSSSHKVVYLLTGLQRIQAYSFVDNEEIHTVYDVAQ